MKTKRTKITDWMNASEAAARIGCTSSFVNQCGKKGVLERVVSNGLGRGVFLYRVSDIEDIVRRDKECDRLTRDKAWLTMDEATVFIIGGRKSLMRLAKQGLVGYQEHVNRYNTVRMFFLKADIKKLADKGIKGRGISCVRANRRGVRPKRVQPVVADDINKLVNKWIGSEDQRAYRARFCK